MAAKNEAEHVIVSNQVLMNQSTECVRRDSTHANALQCKCVSKHILVTWAIAAMRDSDSE